MKKTEQKKLFVVRNTLIRRFLGSLRRVCADQRRPKKTLGGSVRCTDAPPVRICNVYDIYELAEAENRAGKASDGPEHGLGTLETGKLPLVKGGACTHTCGYAR